jgi:hypothetical protein
MCNVKEPANIQEIVGYKIVFKEGNKYLSPFAGKEIGIGKVYDMPFYNFEDQTKYWFYVYDELDNPNMIGKTTVFKSLEEAQIILKVLNKDESNLQWKDCIIIKIKITGNIIKGTSARIVEGFNNYIVYAGEEVLEIEEINN